MRALYVLLGLLAAPLLTVILLALLVILGGKALYEHYRLSRTARGLADMTALAFNFEAFKWFEALRPKRMIEVYPHFKKDLGESLYPETEDEELT